MTESKLYQTIIKPDLSKQGCFLHRFESAHIPDLYISCNNGSLWAELKCINRQQKTIKPAWRPGQLAWIFKHFSYGSKNICLILYYCGEVFYLPPKHQFTKEELQCQKDKYLKTYLNL